MSSSPLSLLTNLSLAVSTSCTESPTGIGTIAPTPGPPPFFTGTQPVNGTLGYTCPPVPTVFLNVTEFVPLTATTTASYFNTTTQPITIFQTIVSTTILTSTEYLTETSTTATPSPTTATATQDIFPYTTTSKITSITVCPTRVANPTFIALEPYPGDWTWGCPPGWLCKPLQQNCNFEFGIPDRNFYCSPNECVPAESLPNPLPTWDSNIYGNSTPAENAGLTVNALDSYFNMAPGDFGLSYEIFVANQVLTLTSTTLILPTQAVAARQAQTVVPGACYPWCNNCLLEAQGNGKTSALCVPGSAFEVSLQQCEQCIKVHKSDGSGSFVQIAPQFQQFLDYCEQFATVVVTTSVPTITTNSAGSAYSTTMTTLATTVTPKSSPSPPPTSSTSGETTVATVVTTSYSQSTVTGTAWSQVTIIMPADHNSTTTIYGSDLTSGATLVLPEAATTSSYTTTMTLNSNGLVSGASTTSSGSATVSGSGTNGASKLQFYPGEGYWRTIVFGGMISLILALSL